MISAGRGFKQLFSLKRKALAEKKQEKSLKIPPGALTVSRKTMKPGYQELSIEIGRIRTESVGQAAGVYGRIWERVYSAEYAIKKPEMTLADYMRRESLRFQEWVVDSFPETQLAAYCPEAGLLIGKINAIPKSIPKIEPYMELPEDWEEMLQFRNSLRGNLIVPVSVGVLEEYRRYGVAKRLIEEASRIALRSGYKTMATYSTILACGKETPLDEHFSSPKNGTDPVKAFHEGCGAKLVRTMEGKGERRVRYGFPAASFLYFDI